MGSSSPLRSDIEDSPPRTSTYSSSSPSPVASTSKLPAPDFTPPRLPTELLLQIFLSYALSPVLFPTPQTYSTLRALLATCHLARDCARQQLYEILILPRRVREFRKYYDTERDRGWIGAGRTRGLFCALDDVSRLTHTSAGWETAFLRTLHILGPSIGHLSLWHSESRTLLRDAGQIRSKRNLRGSDPAWAWGEDEELDFDEDSEDDAEGVTERAGGKGGSEVIRSPEEVAAMRERARQRLPNWLQAELTSSSSAGEVARRHRAHLQPLGDPSDSTSSVSGGPDLLESHLVAERRLRLKRDRRLLKGCRPTSLSIVLSLPLFENQEPALFASMVVFSRCEELDVYMPVPAHAPKLLWLLSHLHRSPLRRIKITTNHFSLCMSVGPFDQVGEAKRRRADREERRRRKRWRAQAIIHAQDDGEEGSGLSLQYCPDKQNQEDRSGEERKWPINLATSLRLLLESETIRQALLWEFTGRHYDRPQRLEKVLHDVALKSQDVDPEMFVREGATSALGSVQQWCSSAGEVLADVLSTSLSLDAPLSASASNQYAPSYGDGQDYGGHLPEEAALLRVRVLQGNQGGAGKMKDRREDFIERSLGLGEGIWKRCGLWDDA